MKSKFLFISFFLVIGFLATSCSPASQQIVLNNAVDYGLHQLKKEVKLIKLDVPVRSLDGQMYSTPLGFFHFWIVQRIV